MGYKTDNDDRRQSSGRRGSGGLSRSSGTEGGAALDLIWKGLIGGFFLLLPFVVSTSGFESFDTPKNVFMWVSVAVIGIFGFVTRRVRIPERIGYYDILVIGALGYLFLHALVAGRIPAALTGLMSCLAMVVLYFGLRSITSVKFHQYLWLGIAVSISLNAVFTILQQLDMFPLLVGSGRADASDRLVPAGFIGEVNRGGFLFALTLLILLYFIFNGTWRKPGKLVFSAVLAGAILAGLAFSRTMTSILGLAACLLVWVAFHSWFVIRKQEGGLRKAVIFGMIVLAGIAGITALGYRAGVADRLEGITEHISQDAWIYATSGRTPLFHLTWEMIKESPWMGRGLNSFPGEFFKFKTESKEGRAVKLMPQPGAFKEVHNEYLQTWLELGIAGLAFLLLLLGVPVFYGLRLLYRGDHSPDDTYWVYVLLLGQVFTGITCLAFFPLHLSVTAPFICLVIAGLMQLADPFTDPGRVDTVLPGRSRVSRWIQYGLAGVLVGYSTWAVYIGINTWKVNRTTGMVSYILTRSMSEPLNSRQKISIIKEALHLLDEVEKERIQLADIYNLKGTAYLLSGRYGESAGSFRDSIGLAPSPEAYVNLATAYLSQGKNKEAQDCLVTAQAYDIENQKAIQLMTHMFREGLFSKEESLRQIEALRRWNTIGLHQAIKLYRNLRDKGTITREEYSSLVDKEKSRSGSGDEDRD